MAHENPLHADVVVQCWCCRSLQPFHFDSAADPVVCAHCTGHLGAERAERRDQDHVGLWLELWTREHEARLSTASGGVAAADAAAERVADLEAQLAQLTAAVADRNAAVPAGRADDRVQSELVRRAERNTELARRLADRLSVLLWRLDRLHHDDPDRPGRCSCGRGLAECPESRILDADRRAIRDWEERNLRLLADGRRHALPDDHPAVAPPATEARRPRR